MEPYNLVGSTVVSALVIFVVFLIWSRRDLLNFSIKLLLGLVAAWQGLNAASFWW